jgi:hypothetical protein
VRLWGREEDKSLIHLAFRVTESFLVKTWYIALIQFICGREVHATANIIVTFLVDLHRLSSFSLCLLSSSSFCFLVHWVAVLEGSSCFFHSTISFIHRCALVTFRDVPCRFDHSSIQCLLKVQRIYKVGLPAVIIAKQNIKGKYYYMIWKVFQSAAVTALKHSYQTFSWLLMKLVLTRGQVTIKRKT